MCKKQCRDQNGFKCHLTSETHQRQLLLFAENPDTYLKEYSEEFENNFLKVCFIGFCRSVDLSSIFDQKAFLDSFEHFLLHEIYFVWTKFMR